MGMGSHNMLRMVSNSLHTLLHDTAGQLEPHEMSSAAADGRRHT